MVLTNTAIFYGAAHRVAGVDVNQRYVNPAVYGPAEIFLAMFAVMTGVGSEN